MAFCPDDDCRALTWDPTLTAKHLLEHSVEVPGLTYDTRPDDQPLEPSPPLPFGT